MSELPQGWESVTLGTVTKPRAGKVVPERADHRPYLSLDGIESGSKLPTKWEVASDYRSQSVQLFPGDVAYSRLRPYLNKVVVVDRAALGSSELIVFPQKSVLEPRFLSYRLSSPDFVAFADLNSDGDRPRLKWKQMQGFRFALPPLAEQRRIIAAIEEHFSRLDAAEAALERSLQRLAALESLSIADSSEPDWPEVPLSTVLEETGGKVLKQGWSPKCIKTPSPDDATWGVLKTSAIQVRKFDETENKELPGSLEPRPDLEVQAGDLIMTSGGPRNRIGVTCLAASPRPRLMLSDKMFRFRANPRVADSEFLLLYLTSPQGLSHLERIKTGSNDSGLRISQKNFAGLPVRLPPLAVQRAVVCRAAQVASQSESVRGAVNTSSRRAASLRRSVLAAAFSGHLVSQDPTDEPASELLARVAAERATTKPSSEKKATK